MTRAFLLLAPLLLFAAEPAWEPLFDGRTNKGWKVYRSQGFPEHGWEIDETEAALRAVPGNMMACLATEEVYDNFDLEFEWKISPGGNAGVFYSNRKWNERGNYRVHSSRGQEYQILDDELSAEGAVAHKSAASLYGKVAPIPDKPLRPAGEWNTGRIVVQGLYAEHWLNGVRVLTYQMAPADKVASPIVLQHHHDEAWFRNLRIRRLP
ncbi:MAG: DUF1080 domain-containing protein [Bryobacteraceae bacterium]|nr:DUF1080 domain-containing protein [Bryobacteraceae bacterium]